MKIRFALGQPLRSLLAMALVPAALIASPLALANDKVVLLTSWYAQAEQGGFYQALADGLYEKEGLDVTIRMGGPQVNGMQLLLNKQADFIVNYDLQILKSVEQGLPVVAVAAPFQGDPQGLLTHADVSGLDALQNKQVLVSTSGQQTWWPWLKEKYQLKDSQARPYTFNLQPFLANANTTQQAYASSELFQALKAGEKANFFPFCRRRLPALRLDPGHSPGCDRSTSGSGPALCSRLDGGLEALPRQPERQPPDQGRQPEHER
ncbi:hypothetical protein SRABI89_01832 [Pseudomonas koreensis]|nr:hypothetical protein SRABI89_01832 [Pseudomonas koreensis]